MTERLSAACGILAFLVFWIALLVFAAVRPEYSHLTKAISELGVIGAPQAVAWNLVGFIVPGLLLAACGAGLATAIDGRRGALWWLLVLSGVAFAGTGFIPAEMQNGSPLMQSPLTQGHVLMSLLSGILWLVAAFLLLSRIKSNPAWSHLRAVGAILALVVVATIGLNVFSEMVPFLDRRPGLVQRASFGAYFLWFLVMSIYLISPERRTR